MSKNDAKKPSLASVLKRVRNDHGLSQHDLARLLKVSQPTVQRWESNDGYPRQNVAARVRQFLTERGVRVGDSLRDLENFSAPVSQGPLIQQLLKAGIDLDRISSEAMSFLAVWDAKLTTELETRGMRVLALEHERSALLAELDNLRNEIKRLTAILSSRSGSSR